MPAGSSGASPVLGNGVQRRSIAFRFFPQGNSTTPYTIANGQLVDPDGWIASCFRTGTAGRYAIDLACPVAKVLSCVVTVQNVSAADTFAKLAEFFNEGVATAAFGFRVEHVSGAALADIAANANNSLLVTLDVELANRSPS